MRFEGTLTQWNDDRGFGFITPLPTGQEIFVHISAFARDGQRPLLNEALSFEITLNKDGKKQACAVRRLISTAASSPAPRERRAEAALSRESNALPTRAVVIVLVCALLAAAYWHYDRRNQRAKAMQMEAAAQALEVPARPPSAALPQPLGSSPYRCDGRQHCSQMTSCSEARFFLQNCPGTKMDGDGDGVPCEEQWCTSPLAK
jgi:cold shock CspA family protein